MNLFIKTQLWFRWIPVYSWAFMNHCVSLFLCRLIIQSRWLILAQFSLALVEKVVPLQDSNTIFGTLWVQPALQKCTNLFLYCWSKTFLGGNIKCPAYFSRMLWRLTKKLVTAWSGWITQQNFHHGEFSFKYNFHCGLFLKCFPSCCFSNMFLWYHIAGWLWDAFLRGIFTIRSKSMRGSGQRIRAPTGQYSYLYQCFLCHFVKKLRHNNDFKKCNYVTVACKSIHSV